MKEEPAGFKRIIKEYYEHTPWPQMFLNHYFTITGDIQYYISCRCTHP